MRDTTKRFLCALTGVVVFLLLVPFATTTRCIDTITGRGGGCVTQQQDAVLVAYSEWWPSRLPLMIAVLAGLTVYLVVWRWVSPKRLPRDKDQMAEPEESLDAASAEDPW
jgi:hypothetical protein